MKAGTIVKASFAVSILLTILGAYLKITHAPSAELLLIIGVIASLVFIISAIYEVRTSNRVDFTEKTMWTLAFVFFGGIAGLVYFFIGRKRIVAERL
jgi:hypothetical protein